MSVYKEMRCAACGYIRAVFEEAVEEVVRFKSGKRKGEIKGSEDRIVRFEVGHTDFIEVGLYRNVDEFSIESGDDWYYDNNGCSVYKNCVSLYACPECGTIKMVE